MTRKYNPFRPGSIVGPGMFCGRIEELNAFERCLNQTKLGNPQHFALIGERGIGKSSLLLYVQLLAEGEISPMQGEDFNFLTLNIELTVKNDFIDIVRALAREFRTELREKDALKKMVEDLWESLSKWEILRVRFHKEKREFDPYSELNELVSKMVDLLKTAGEQIDGIVILIDEADKPGKDARLGELLKILTEKLSKSQSDRVFIGLAGLSDLISNLAASHESSPRIFEAMTLEPLEISERKQVVRKGLDEANNKNDVQTTVTEGALSEIASLSEGYPHFIQQFAFCAFDVDEDDELNTNDVIEGAFQQNGAIHQLGEKFFSKQYFEEINSDDYRLVLDTMANHLDGWLNRKDIIDETGLKPDTVDNALRSLKEKKIIIAKNPAGKGPVKLPTKSFAVWIRAQNTLTEEIEPTLNLE